MNMLVDGVQVQSCETEFVGHPNNSSFYKDQWYLYLNAVYAEITEFSSLNNMFEWIEASK